MRRLKTGGWIQKAIKHPGRCSNPGDSRCPKGSPQYNLAMRFKHGDLHKKQIGGEVDPNADPSEQGAPTPPQAGPQKVPMNAVRPPKKSKVGRLPKRRFKK